MNDIIGQCNDCKNWTDDKTCIIRTDRNGNQEHKTAGQHCSYWEQGRHLTRPENEDNKEEIELTQEIMTLRDLLRDGIPEIEWYVRDIVPKGGITIFGGTSGGFKTWNAMQLSLALCTGTRFMNEFSTKKATVLYIDEENGNVTIPNRFNRLVNGHALTEEPLDNLYISIFNGVTVDNLEGARLLNALILKLTPDVVIIDSTVRCMTGQENDAADVKQIFVTLKPHIDAGISFVLLHHTVKNDVKSMAGLRGSGDFSAFADVVIMFEAGKEGYFNTKIVKNRHIEITEMCEFFGCIENIDDDSLLIEYKGIKDNQGNVIDRCVDDICEWIQTEKIKEFITPDIVNLMVSSGHKKNRVFSALNLLVKKDNKLIKLKRGKYKVIIEEFQIVESEIV